MDRHEARIPHVNVVPVRKVQGVAPDKCRTIAAEPVFVEILIALDVERQPAVELQQDGDLIVVEERTHDVAPMADCRTEHDAAVEVVPHVHQVRALVAIEVRRIGAELIAHDDEA